MMDENDALTGPLRQSQDLAAQSYHSYTFLLLRPRVSGEQTRLFDRGIAVESTWIHGRQSNLLIPIHWAQ